MRKTLPSIFFVLLGSLLATPAVYAHSQGNGNEREFEAKLRGDTNIRGHAQVKFNRDQTGARVTLKVAKLGDGEVTEAHLNCAPGGTINAVVASLLAPISGNYHGKPEIRFSITTANLASSPSVTCEGIEISSIEALLEAMRAGNINADATTSDGVIQGQFRPD